MWPTNKDDTKSYHLCLLATYKLVYYGHKMLRICMVTKYELVYGRENTTNLYVFKYKFNTTNSYVTNQKKLAIEKHSNLYETAFAYRKKKLSIKKGTPP
jgi:hypothetical protein